MARHESDWREDAPRLPILPAPLPTEMPHPRPARDWRSANAAHVLLLFLLFLAAGTLAVFTVGLVAAVPH